MTVLFCVYVTVWSQALSQSAEQIWVNQFTINLNPSLFCNFCGTQWANSIKKCWDFVGKHSRRLIRLLHVCFRLNSFPVLWWLAQFWQLGQWGAAGSIIGGGIQIHETSLQALAQSHQPPPPPHSLSPRACLQPIMDSIHLCACRKTFLS